MLRAVPSVDQPASFQVVDLLGQGTACLVWSSPLPGASRIRSIVGDRVQVEMTPYDLTKGRIVFREKTAPIPMNQRRFFRR